MPNHINFYREQLLVNKHALDDALEVQAQYQDEISRSVAELNTRMLEAKDCLARTEATVLARLKQDKVSDVNAAGQVKLDVNRREDFALYQEVRREYEEWAGLLDAWRSRGYSLKTLADLYGAQYFAITSAGAAKEPAVDAARAAMRDVARRRQIK